jgi:hypothetical protein
MYPRRNSFLKYGIDAALILFILISVSGCMMLASRGLRQGYDELQALDAINRLAEKSPYVDYKQIFPDTYRFELSKKQVYDKIIKQLTAHGEAVIKQDKKKGVIYTAAKEAPRHGNTDETDDQDKIFYQQSIYLTPKNNRVTYVTNYPTVLKGDFQEMIIPLARNMLRGIFFGSLAAEIHPERKRKALSVAREMHIISNMNTKCGDIIHEVQVGETLGDIAKKYTGQLMNYKEIAEYNNIKDATKIQVGQKIKIPQHLQ